MATSNLETLAQRKVPLYPRNNKASPDNTILLTRLTYGVPAPKRMLSPGLLLKKHDRVNHYLKGLDLTPAEREVTFNLLRLFAYYGRVYPKANGFTPARGCSRRSFWRAVSKLEVDGLIDRQHRYVNHLQISNCYRLDKLVLCIIRYLAEHGSQAISEFAHGLLKQVGQSFWPVIWTLRVRLRDPNPLTALA